MLADLRDYFRSIKIYWIVFSSGTLLGIVLVHVFHSWLMLLLTAIYCGLYFSNYLDGMKWGALTTFTIYTFFTTFNMLFTDYISLKKVYFEILGLDNIDFYLLIILDLVMVSIGIIGGYFGSTLRNLGDFNHQN